MEINSAAGHYSRNCMLVNHLGHSVFKQDNILIKGLNVTLQFDTVNKVDRNGHVLFSQQIQKGVLQKLAFVTHDIFRVESLREGPR